MWLQVRNGPDAGTAAELPTDRPFVLGRQRGCDLIVRDSRASRRHAELTPMPGNRWRLRDLDSANGTSVDGSQAGEAVLEGGEDLRIGDQLISVTLAPPPGRGAGAGAAAPAEASSRPTPGEETEAAPRLATQSMVQRLVDAGSRRASRTGLVAGGAALLAVVAVAALLATGVLGGSGDAIPDVVARAAPSAVLVSTARDGAATGTGSGWVLDAAQGLIVTNGHVVNQGTAFTVASGGRARPATVAAVAPCEDLALLRVRDTGGLKTATLAPSGSVQQGEGVVAIGYGADAAPGDPPGATSGVVSAQDTTFADPAADVPAYPSALQTDTPLNPGNSGGPLVDLEARVVGVDSAARTTGSDGRALQNVNYAITIDHARGVLADLRTGRAAAWTGLTFAYPTSATLRDERLPDGLRVTGAIAGTPAAGAPIKPGDLLAGVDDQPIANTLSSLCDALAGRASGDEVTLAFASPGRAKPRFVKIRLA